jgi:hypothetical protein
VQWFLLITNEQWRDQRNANKQSPVFAKVRWDLQPAFQIQAFMRDITLSMFQRFFRMELQLQTQFLRP